MKSTKKLEITTNKIFEIIKNFYSRGLRANGTKTYAKEIIHCLN